MSFDYGRMKSQVADRLLANFSQGVISIIQVVKVPPANNYDLPTTTEIKTRVDGVVRGVGKELVDGVNILSSDLELLCNVVPDNLKPTDQVEINGKRYTIIHVHNIPAAGVKVVTKMVIRA